MLLRRIIAESLVLCGAIFLMTFTQEIRASVRILALGDSLTAGYRLPREKAYPAQLAKSLREEGHEVEITNAGVSGDTAAQALGRLEWVVQRAGPFEVALVALGANDGLRRSSVEAMTNALEKIIERLKKEGTHVFLLGMRLPLNYDKAYRESFEVAYSTLAKKHSVPLMPFVLEGVAMKKEYNLQDMIHPNEEGQAIIAKNLKKWLLSQESFKKALDKGKAAQ